MALAQAGTAWSLSSGMFCSVTCSFVCDYLKIGVGPLQNQNPLIILSDNFSRFWHNWFGKIPPIWKTLKMPSMRQIRVLQIAQRWWVWVLKITNLKELEKAQPATGLGTADHPTLVTLDIMEYLNWMTLKKPNQGWTRDKQICVLQITLLVRKRIFCKSHIPQIRHFTKPKSVPGWAFPA